MSYNYKALYEKQAQFYRKRPVAKQILELAHSFLTWLFVLGYVAQWLKLISAETFIPIEGFRTLLPLAICLLTVTALRMMIDRARPYSEDGTGITPLIKRKKTDRNSCPSRHLACAVTIALICWHFSKVEGIVLLVASLGMGYTRFATGMHYLSDLLIGGAVGLACGILTFIL